MAKKEKNLQSRGITKYKKTDSTIFVKPFSYKDEQNCLSNIMFSSSNISGIIIFTKNTSFKSTSEKKHLKGDIGKGNVEMSIRYNFMDMT